MPFLLFQNNHVLFPRLTEKPMTTPASVKITPMMQQYLEIKAQHQDAILFYRLGDFYEMFFDDAVTASKILGITLTSRNSKDNENRVPLCGIPYHAVSSYLAKMIKAGFKVAICEQVEDPKEAKGVVRREVVRVVTPGLVTDEQLLDDKDNRYLAAICQKGRNWGLSLLDLSTGEFLVSEREDLPALLDELGRLAPSEILLPGETGETSSLTDELQAYLPQSCLTRRQPAGFYPETARQRLLEHFRVANLAGFGCEEMKSGIGAAGALLLYLQETQKTALDHIERLTPIEFDHVLLMDESSRRNLELTQTLTGGAREGSLLDTLDLCETPMGARLLKKNLLFPLQEVEAIRQRLDTVEQLYLAPRLREELRQLLAKVYDLERLNGRVVLGTANARDLTALKCSLAQLPQLKERLTGASGLLSDLGSHLDELSEVHALLVRGGEDDAVPVGAGLGRHPAGAGGELVAEVEVLDALHPVDVGFLDVVGPDPRVAGRRSRELAVARQGAGHGAGRGAGHRLVPGAVAVPAALDALHEDAVRLEPAAQGGLGDAAAHPELGVLLRVAVDDLLRHRTLPGDRRGAARVERVEGARQRRGAGVPGVAARVAAVERQARAHEARVAVAEGARGLVPRAAVIEGHALAVAEDVAFLEPDPEEALPSFRARREARVRGPAVLAAHERVDAAVGPLDRDDVDAAEGAVGAQVSLGLNDLQRVPDLARREQQLAPDDGLARGVVDPVGEAERPPVLAHDRRIEHVDALDEDLADLGARRRGGRQHHLSGAGGAGEQERGPREAGGAPHRRRRRERISEVECERFRV